MEASTPNQMAAAAPAFLVDVSSETFFTQFIPACARLSTGHEFQKFCFLFLLHFPDRCVKDMRNFHFATCCSALKHFKYYTQNGTHRTGDFITFNLYAASSKGYTICIAVKNPRLPPFNLAEGSSKARVQFFKILTSYNPFLIAMVLSSQQPYLHRSNGDKDM